MTYPSTAVAWSVYQPTNYPGSPYWYCRSLVSTPTNYPGSPYWYSGCCTGSSDKAYDVSKLLAVSFQTTPPSAVLLRKLTDPHVLQKLQAFSFANCTFITALTKACRRPRSIQFMTPSHFFRIHFNIIHPITPRSSLGIFPSGLHLVSFPQAFTWYLSLRPSLGIFPSSLPITAPYATLLSRPLTCCKPRPSLSTGIYHPSNIRREVQKSESCVENSQHGKFLKGGVVNASPNAQAGRPPHVGHVRLIILYVCLLQLSSAASFWVKTATAILKAHLQC